MIQAMTFNKVSCEIDEMSIIDNQDGFYSYHSEQWNLYAGQTELGFVTIMERQPLVTHNGGRYELQCFTVPENEYCSQGYDRYNKQVSRVHLLQNAIRFIENN